MTELVMLDVILGQKCYFAGDVIKARLYIRFLGRTMLEWATAQLHGHVAFDPHLVSPQGQSGK